VSIRAQAAPTVVHLTQNLTRAIYAQHLRGPGTFLRELVGNSVSLPGNPSERDPPRIAGHLRFDLLLELDQVLGPRTRCPGENLSVRLAEAGRHDEAVRAEKEAAELACTTAVDGR